MDMQTPTEPIEVLSPHVPRALLNCLLRMIIAALPTAGLGSELAAETEEAARAMFFGMQPRDPAEAAAVARAVSAHFASLHMYARAARPGLSDDTVMRLLATANKCARAADAARPLQAGPKPPKVAQKTQQPAPEPEQDAPRIILFQPRDRFGQPITDGDQMTVAQRRAHYAWPRDPELEAIAIAEEEAMIAEQQAADAKTKPQLT